jgi:5-methylcytosine-specific restriction protein A
LTARTNWSDEELRSCIEAYFQMLKFEKDQTPYTKSEINKELREQKLMARTRASVEYRMQNISSVLLENNMPILSGYKPANNVGKNMKEKIWKMIVNRKG